MLPVEEVIEKIKDILIPILQEEGLELVDIEFKPSGRRWTLRIFIDKDGGVSIFDCETVSRGFSRILDIEDFIEHPYTLEVSSPGLTRPLKKPEDYLRFMGKSCRIITKTAIQGMNEFSGIIDGADEQNVIIKGNIDVFTIPFCVIKKAHLEFEM